MTSLGVTAAGEQDSPALRNQRYFRSWIHMPKFLPSPLMELRSREWQSCKAEVSSQTTVDHLKIYYKSLDW